MKDFVKSRRFLTLVAFIAVPAALVVALSGSLIPSYAQSSAVLRVQFTSVTCSLPLTLLSLNAGDKVSGPAELKSNDSQVSAGDSLLLRETKGPFAQTIGVNSGSHSFSFTAAGNNDALTACITGQGQSNPVATIALNSPSSGELNILKQVLGSIF
jgi:hypothetical protein